MNKNAPRTASYWVSRIVLVFLIVTTFFPFVMLINMSLKPTVLITTDFLGLPKEPYWQNFSKALSFVGRPILNSFLICGASLGFILLHVSLSGYAFARLRFKGKRFLFGMLVAVMMVPTTITIVPQYLIMQKLRLINKYWALILPYIASQQVFGIMLAKAAFEQMPNDIFEAAKIDGANEFSSFLRIGLPLLNPTLVTVGITVVVAMYNDYIWPTIALTGGDDMKTFCQIVFNAASGIARTDLGLVAASFILGTIPLMLITCSCLKYYLEGMVAGAVKG